MSSIESGIRSGGQLPQVMECMICGAVVQFIGENRPDSDVACSDCGSEFAVLNTEPLSFHFPGQECGE